jgi:erythromycin esterase-like protein
MPPPVPTPASLDDWVAREAIPFALDPPAAFNAAADQLMRSVGDGVELLGLGEALHGGEEVLTLRNRLFERLVEAHGYSAIAIESSFPKARLVDEYVAGRGPASYEEVREAGFSHGFGRLDASRELVEWMRRYNADPAHRVKLRFYGFDSPTEMTGTDSPRRLLHFALDYLASVGGSEEPERRRRIDAHLGPDAAWENPEAMMDPAKAIGLSPAATALRIETEDLITELGLRRPELAAEGHEDRYREAVQYASAARGLLNYHAVLARPSGTRRLIEGLGLRDAMMADNLAYMVARERGRGKVLVFAHNTHLKLGRAQWQLGPHALEWWPAGAHLRALLGPRYCVVGSAVGVSDANGIGRPEAGTLEARLTAAPGPARFIPTHHGQGLPAAEIAALPTRSGSTRNGTYFALIPQSFTDFDWLAILDSVAYNRGGPPLP